MIDWDVKEITLIDNHYHEILSPSINFIYFCQHFEEIYMVIIDDETLLPDILNDITFYTVNGINAKDKVLIPTNKEEEITEKLSVKRMKQIAKRQKARNTSLNAYHEFILNEVIDFVKEYPFWSNLLRN